MSSPAQPDAAGGAELDITGLVTLLIASAFGALKPQIRRAGCFKCRRPDGRTWDLPKSFTDYKVADPQKTSVRGAAPKVIIERESDPEDWYIVKAAEMHGARETLTELLINQLGRRLGFEMAHSGVVRLNGELCFCSHNFLQADEDMRHGSVLIESFFDYDLGAVGKNPWSEQRTYDVDMIRDLLEEYCKEDFTIVFQGFVDMLVFDALTGSMDRHMQNWGVVATRVLPEKRRFAPIFDSARALLWDYEDDKIERLTGEPVRLKGYTDRARPKVGFASTGKAINHFQLVDHLFARYPEPTKAALTKVTPEKVSAASKLVREYPFKRAFSQIRIDTIIKLLAIRSERLEQIASGKGGANV